MLAGKRGGIADEAFQAAGGDPLKALLLVLELIWSGKLVVSRERDATMIRRGRERLAA